jgi:hypothetical protein
MRRTRNSLALIALAVLLLPLAAIAQESDSESDPLGEELFTAKKVLLLNTVMDFSLSSAFTNELLDWERFEMVFSEEDADLCFALSAQDDYRQEVILSGEQEAEEGLDDALGGRTGRTLGTMRTLDTLYLKVFVPGGDDLWTDQADVGDDESAARLLITRLRKKMEEQESAKNSTR